MISQLLEIIALKYWCRCIFHTFFPYKTKDKVAHKAHLPGNLVKNKFNSTYSVLLGIIKVSQHLIYYYNLHIQAFVFFVLIQSLKISLSEVNHFLFKIRQEVEVTPCSLQFDLILFLSLFMTLGLINPFLSFEGLVWDREREPLTHFF